MKGISIFRTLTKMRIIFAHANPYSDQARMRMKKKLMALHPANGDMLLLLKGEPGLICRDLKRLF